MENRGSSSPGEPLLFFCPIFLSIVIRQKNVLGLKGSFRRWSMNSRITVEIATSCGA